MTRPPSFYTIILCFGLGRFAPLTATLAAAMVASTTAFALLLIALGLGSVVLIVPLSSTMVTASATTLVPSVALPLGIVFGCFTQALGEGEFQYLAADELLDGSKA